MMGWHCKTHDGKCSGWATRVSPAWPTHSGAPSVCSHIPPLLPSTPYYLLQGILFGVPGAFTPGCSKTHLPGCELAGRPGLRVGGQTPCMPGSLRQGLPSRHLLGPSASRSGNTHVAVCIAASSDPTDRLHLPLSLADVADFEKLTAAGAEVIVCVSVNDAFAVSGREPALLLAEGACIIADGDFTLQRGLASLRREFAILPRGLASLPRELALLQAAGRRLNAAGAG